MKLLAHLIFAAVFLSTSLAIARPLSNGDHFSQPELDQMLAPVALYPDALLSQVLIAATHPREIAEVARWARANPNLNGEEAIDAVEDLDYNASVKALAAFPRLLTRMDDDHDWTRRIGNAFTTQEEDVMTTIQNLRRKAHEAGNLISDNNIRVHRGRETIYIEPARSGIMLLPYYRATVVYGGWLWPSHPPVCWAPPIGGFHGAPLAWSAWSRITVCRMQVLDSNTTAQAIIWTRPTIVSHRFFFTNFDWQRRHVIIRHVHHHHHSSRQIRTVIERRMVIPDGSQRWRHDDHSHRRRDIAHRNDSLSRRHGREPTSSIIARQTASSNDIWMEDDREIIGGSFRRLNSDDRETRLTSSGLRHGGQSSDYDLRLDSSPALPRQRQHSFRGLASSNQASDLNMAESTRFRTSSSQRFNNGNESNHHRFSTSREPRETGEIRSLDLTERRVERRQHSALTTRTRMESQASILNRQSRMINAGNMSERRTPSRTMPRVRRQD